MYIQRLSLFGPADFLELSVVVAVGLVIVWVVPDWDLPWRTPLTMFHTCQAFFSCMTQPVNSSRFALAMVVLLVDFAALAFQYAIWTGYADGLRLDKPTGDEWRERLKFGIIFLLFLITATRALDSRIDVKAASLAKEMTKASAMRRSALTHDITDPMNPKTIPI